MIQELYRVRLPFSPDASRGVVVGEGKPENQNHSVIFVFGEALQTIDMNQVRLLLPTCLPADVVKITLL